MGRSKKEREKDEPEKVVKHSLLPVGWKNCRVRIARMKMHDHDHLGNGNAVKTPAPPAEVKEAATCPLRRSARIKNMMKKNKSSMLSTPVASATSSKNHNAPKKRKLADAVPEVASKSLKATEIITDLSSISSGSLVSHLQTSPKENDSQNSGLKLNEQYDPNELANILTECIGLLTQIPSYVPESIIANFIASNVLFTENPNGNADSTIENDNVPSTSAAAAAALLAASQKMPNGYEDPDNVPSTSAAAAAALLAASQEMPNGYEDPDNVPSTSAAAAAALLAASQMMPNGYEDPDNVPSTSAAAAAALLAASQKMPNGYEDPDNVPSTSAAAAAALLAASQKMPNGYEDPDNVPSTSAAALSNRLLHYRSQSNPWMIPRNFPFWKNRHQFADSEVISVSDENESVDNDVKKNEHVDHDFGLIALLHADEAELYPEKKGKERERENQDGGVNGGKGNNAGHVEEDEEDSNDDDDNVVVLDGEEGDDDVFYEEADQAPKCGDESGGESGNETDDESGDDTGDVSSDPETASKARVQHDQ